MKHIDPPYQKHLSDNVWQRENAASFAYSDGDEVENRIASIITSAADLSVLSSELRTHITDWPSNYHLSSQRANLLRPLHQHLSGSVLEIGSGCGAITRYLGETATAVMALEGSRRRAHITRARTRDLDNVEVYCDEFSAFEVSKKFDAVTLIGVLEYAHMFISDAHAALRMLEKTKALLNDEGSLIIAIENQLGLKYFAGAPEDHLGKPMLGIEDQYAANGVRTYGKESLRKMLQTAGYESIEFLHPFPDYKMPSCVLAENAFNSPSFNAKPFLISTAGKDPQLPPAPNFSLERAWSTIESNGLASALSNSFLIVAKKKAEFNRPTNELAWHFSTQRVREFCKETIFARSTRTGKIEIRRNFLSQNSFNVSSNSAFTHSLNDTSPYSKNDLLNKQLIDVITQSNWSYENIADVVFTYAKHLGNISEKSIISNGKIDWELEIPGEFYDCIPQNIYIDDTGKAISFDLEWSSTSPINFKLLTIRSLLTTVGEISIIGQNSDGIQPSLLNLLQKTMILLGHQLSDEEAFQIIKNELNFQTLTSGKLINYESAWDTISNKIIKNLSGPGSLADYKHHCDNLEAKLKHDEAFHNLKIEQEKSEKILLNDTFRAERSSQDEAFKHELALKEVAFGHERAAQDGIYKNTIAELQADHNHALGNALNAAERLGGEAALSKRALTESFRAIRGLTQASAKQYIERKSLRNFLKQLLEYRQVIRKSSAKIQSPLKGIVSSVLTAFLGYSSSSPRPNLRGHSYVALEEEAEALMHSSAHWAIPFDWTLSHGEIRTAKQIELTGQTLGIPVVTVNGSDSTPVAASSFTLSNDITTGSIIGFPKKATLFVKPGDFHHTIPDAESIRQAYMAMISDTDLSMIYIEAKNPNPAEKPDKDIRNFFCLVRFSSNSQYDKNSTIFKQQISFTELDLELSGAKELNAANKTRFLCI